MTMNITLVPERAHTNAKSWFLTLARLADELWALVVPHLKAEDRRDEAIAILRDPSASPDMCDWAERYLCGMEGTDEKRYCDGRRSQS